MAVDYEWDIETVEPSGDIIDNHHHDKLSQLTDTLGFWRPEAANQIVIVLVRFDDDGFQWAYIYPDADGWRMPDMFDGGTVVPRRFQLEWEKYGEEIHAQVDAINSGQFAPRTESNSAFLDTMKEREGQS
jgi:hypothetical protein